MTKQQKIREGLLEILTGLYWSSECADINPKDVDDILKYLHSKGAVIRTGIGSDIQGTALFAFEPLVDDGNWRG